LFGRGKPLILLVELYYRGPDTKFILISTTCNVLLRAREFPDTIFSMMFLIPKTFL